MSLPPLLEVEGLNVSFPGRGGVTRAVRDVSFSLGRERLGIVGESGSGKSTTGRALLGLILRPGHVTARKMQFAGQDLIGMGDAAWQVLRKLFILFRRWSFFTNRISIGFLFYK